MEPNPNQDSVSHINVVYCLIHIASGKKYYGSTSDFLNRKYTHDSLLRCNKHHNRELQNYFNYDRNINYSIIQSFDCREEAYILEQRLIDGDSNCFNKAKDVRSPNKGRSLDQEHKDKIGLKHKNKIISDEAKYKMSIAKIGKKASEETKLKMSINNGAKIKSEEWIEKARKASILTRGKRNIINGVEYETIAAAARDLKLNNETVRQKILSNKPEFDGWKYV